MTCFFYWDCPGDLEAQICGEICSQKCEGEISTECEWKCGHCGCPEGLFETTDQRCVPKYKCNLPRGNCFFDVIFLSDWTKKNHH